MANPDSPSKTQVKWNCWWWREQHSQAKQTIRWLSLE